MRRENFLKILAPSENRITIELSARDMDALNITYEQMDYSNIETRRVVWTLLDRAGHELHRDIDPSGRMLIEALPSGKGGCVLKFTLCPENAVGTTSITKGEKPTVYEFSSLDDILDAADAAGVCCEKSELYRLDGTYRLLMSGFFRQSPPCVLNDFGHERTEAAAASHTKEHWECVISEKALAKLVAS